MSKLDYVVTLFEGIKQMPQERKIDTQNRLEELFCDNEDMLELISIICELA